MNRIAIIGKSKVGQSLAKAIRLAGKDKLTAIIAGREKPYPKINADILIIATRDDSIASVARRAIKGCAKPPRLVVQLAGSRASEEIPLIKDVKRLTLHPLQTFPVVDSDLFQDILWMASSSDPKSIDWAKQFVRSIGSQGIIPLPSNLLPLYHAMTVFSSNFITLLLACVEEMAKSLGQDPIKMKTALAPLVENAVRNAMENSAKEVLTGPIARRDYQTMRKHKDALWALNPKLRKIYESFLNYAVDL